MKSAIPYRVAIFDMDGTLLGPAKQISLENIQALERLRSAGLEVVIASGRHYENIVVFEDRLGLTGWVISAGGAAVQHAGTQEFLHEVTLPSPLALELIQRGQRFGLTIVGYRCTGIFCDKQSEWTASYKRTTGQVPVTDIAELTAPGLQKLIWMNSEPWIEEQTPVLEQEYRDKLYVVNTERDMLEFLNLQANKALAAQVLAKKLGVAREEVIAFGDGNNDVPILEWAGMSVAMDHGNESAKRAAKKISPPGPPETAVARSVEMILSQGQ